MNKNPNEATTMLKTPRHAVIYARVSTRDQEEFGHSIPAQLEALREYGKRHGFKVIKEFAFSESAGPKIRKKFEEVLAFLREHAVGGTMPVLLCQNVDRITRNFRDAVDLDEMRLREGLEIRFTQEGLIINAESSGTDLGAWEMKVFVGKQFLNRVRDDSKRSLKYKLGRGESISYAPLGYLNCDDQLGNSVIKLDEARSMLVRRIFTEYATGAYTIGGITKKAAEWGLVTRKGKKVVQPPISCPVSTLWK